MSIDTRVLQSKPSSQILLGTVTSNGRVAHYRAAIGPFRLELIVLHSQYSIIPLSARHQPAGYATVRLSCSSEELTTVRVLKYRNQQLRRRELHELLQLVAIRKLCSFLEVGPQVNTSVPFDLICHENEAWIFTEWCQPVLEYSEQIEREAK